MLIHFLKYPETLNPLLRTAAMESPLTLGSYKSTSALAVVFSYSLGKDGQREQFLHLAGLQGHTHSGSLHAKPVKERKIILCLSFHSNNTPAHSGPVQCPFCPPGKSSKSLQLISSQLNTS